MSRRQMFRKLVCFILGHDFERYISIAKGEYVYRCKECGFETSKTP